MKKATYEINLDYIFDSTHKGANYSFDNGKHWCNGGDFAEIITKSVLGFEPVKDKNTRYDVASDIQELNASVKSSRFTLVNLKLANDFDETVKTYFKTTHSSIWIFTVVIEKTAMLYYMNKEEFTTFMYQFCFFNEREQIRCKAVSGKMIKWLEERL